ncbi:MAG: hypothetical protein RL748_3428 [Pseudomonadota bacterium]
MKLLSTILFVSAALISNVAQAKVDSQFIMSNQVSLDSSLYQQIGVDLNHIKNNRSINNYMLKALAPNLNATLDPLSSYQTYLPHTTEAPISRFERSVIAAYMDRPDDSTLAKFLGVSHYERAFTGTNSTQSQGQRIKHRILAQYFLQRAKTIDTHGNPILNFLINTNQAAMDNFFSRGNHLDTAENNPGHQYYFETFNYHEENRYLALDKLFTELAVNPNNAMTNTLLNTANFWMGGEAGYDDPTMLYNYVWSSFFSIRSMALAQERELAWKANPAIPRFRLASITGGLSVPSRRWLAQLVHDNQAVAALDTEHEQWRLLQRAFHAFTVGNTLFKEDFPTAFAAWTDGFAHCNEAPNSRTCGDAPRFSFNGLGFVLGYVDMLAKAGDLNTARFLLNYKYAPFLRYNDWTLGRPAWEHREQNLEAISALYRNNDPSDDPSPFFLAKKKWGADTQTCSVCHQAQARVWTDAEKANVSLPDPSVATINNWPAVSTNWFGGVKN